jgi:hypothetical protein
MSVFLVVILVGLSLVIGIVADTRSASTIIRLIGSGAFFVLVTGLAGRLLGYTGDQIASIFALAPQLNDQFGLASSVVLGYALLIGACIVLARRLVKARS